MTREIETMRLFVALELPDTWKQALGRLQDEMRAGLGERFGDSVRVRWVKPDNIHLTLKFLGEVPTGDLPAIEHALAQAVSQPPDLSLSLAGVGSFEDRRAPRVILAGLGGETGKLNSLVEQIETWLSAAGWPREKRSFHPHLTLGRLPDGMDGATRRAVAGLTASFQPEAVPAWTVASVYLIRSRLGPGGAGYDRLASFPL